MTRYLCIHDDGELYWTDDESLAPDDLVLPEEFNRYAVQLCNRVEELERTAKLILQSAIGHHEAAVSDLKRERDEAQRACREAAKYIRLLPRGNRVREDLAERTTLPMLLAMLDDASGEADGGE